jgi:tape measure domain-containing protein
MPRGIEVGRGYIAVDLDDGAAKAALASFGSFAADALKKVALVAGVVSGAAIKMGFDFNSLKEQSLIAFETLLKSGDKAQAMFSNLQKFAAATPFELPGLVDNARQLLGVGVAGEKVIPTLQALGDTAGALGINQDHFNNILLAVTQSMGKGKLQGEELMQMVENGIPVWQLLAEATGKPIPELQKLSSDGKLLAQDVLPKLFAQMEKDYGGAMAKQSQTLSGVWSSLKDNTKSLMGTAFEPLFSLVKTGIGNLGDLAQSSSAQEFATKFAAGMQTAITWSKNFHDSIKERFGDDIKRAFDSLKKSAGDLWDSFKGDGLPALKQIGAGLVDLLPDALKLAQALGGLLKPALEAAKVVLQAVADNMGNFRDLLSTAASTAAAVAGPAFAAFGQVLKIAADIVASLVRVVGDLSGPLGAMAGIALAAMAAWRLFAPAITAVGAAMSAIKPSNVAEALTPLSKKFDNVALSAGLATEKFTGSADAGTKVATSGSKIGNAFRTAGSYLPLVGVALAGLGIVFDLTTRRADELNKAADGIGKGLAIGGSAAVKAAHDLKELENKAASAKAELDKLSSQSGQDEGGGAAQADAAARYIDLSHAVDNARAEVQKYREELGPVGIAQARVQQAQDDYNTAVEKYGKTSAEAIIAQKGLLGETRQLDQAQRNAATATRDHEQSLKDLAEAALAGANADLQLRQSQQGYADALNQLTDLQRSGTATTDQLTNAELSLESAGLRSAQAASEKAKAENAGKDANVIAAASTNAYYGELLRLVGAAGKDAPSALQKLVSNLDSSTASALGAKVSIDATGNAVVRLPDGKQITIAAENAGALREVAELQARLDEVQRHAFITIQTRVAGGLPGLSDLKARARGGGANDNTPYIVGEEGPEIFYPNTSGFIANHKSSMDSIKDAVHAGVSGGDTFNIYEQQDPYSTAMNVSRIQKFNGRLR